MTEISTVDTKNQTMCHQWWHNQQDEAFKAIGPLGDGQREALTALVSECWKAAIRTPYEQPSLSQGRSVNTSELVQWYAQTLYMGEEFLLICHDTMQDKDFGLWPGPGSNPCDVTAILDRECPHIRVLRVIRSDQPLFDQMWTPSDGGCPAVTSAVDEVEQAMNATIIGMEDGDAEEVMRLLQGRLAARLEEIRKCRWGVE